MRKCLAILAAGFFSAGCATPIFAADAQPEYAIIVDAGSSGSRLHLFEYYTDTDRLPVIKDLLVEAKIEAKTKVGLATFAKNPTQAGESLKPIFDIALDYLVNTLHTDPKKVHVSVMGTAGMRMIDQTDSFLIYANVFAYLGNKYPFSIRWSDIETISGKKEGIYDWLDVNYLSGNFANGLSTIGTIDMGGASTQIAFETKDNSKADDKELLNIAGKKYWVYSKSFLGLGQDEARKAMIEKVGEQQASACFPAEAPFSSKTLGDFNFKNCTAHFAAVIKDHHVAEQLPALNHYRFAAFSGAFYTYDFFAVDKTPERQVINQSVQDLCGSGWAGMKERRPQVPEKYLMTYCSNSAYLDQLFFDNYQLRDGQLSVIGKIGNNEIDWTLGALLYQLTQEAK